MILTGHIFLKTWTSLDDSDETAQGYHYNSKTQLISNGHGPENVFLTNIHT